VLDPDESGTGVGLSSHINRSEERTDPGRADTCVSRVAKARGIQFRCSHVADSASTDLGARTCQGAARPAFWVRGRSRPRRPRTGRPAGRRSPRSARCGPRRSPPARPPACVAWRAVSSADSTVKYGCQFGGTPRSCSVCSRSVSYVRPDLGPTWRINEKGPWPARAIRLVTRFRVFFSNQKKRVRILVRVMSASPGSPACRVAYGPPPRADPHWRGMHRLKRLCG
jgi:hypothetical protein